MDGETIKFIRQEIAKQVNIILSGVAGTNTQFVEDISNLYPGMPTITERPVMHPFGISSRAPSGTLQVTARQGDHPANRIVLGHRDSARPSPAQAGETILYDANGHVVYLSQSKMQFGSMSSASNMVLGDILQTFLENLLNYILTHTHEGNLGYPTGVPLNAAQFQSI